MNTKRACVGDAGPGGAERRERDEQVTELKSGGDGNQQQGRKIRIVLNATLKAQKSRKRWSKTWQNLKDKTPRRRREDHGRRMGRRWESAERWRG